jgi:hypothetical protein
MTNDDAAGTGNTDRSRGRLPAMFAVLAFISCNGTIVLIAVFSAIGISVSINPHLQAAAISLFAIATLALVFKDYRQHRAPGPPILAGIAAAILIGTMYIHFNKVVESVGLLALFAAALWGWQVNRQRCGPESSTIDD